MEYVLCFRFLIILIVLIMLLSIAEALDIPIEELTNLSSFHCFNEIRLCIHPLEYCNSDVRECRPCTEDVCRLGIGEIPLQCQLNCTITAAILDAKSKIQYPPDLVQSNPSVWFIMMLASVALNIILLINKICPLERVINLQYLLPRKQSNITSDEEKGLVTPDSGEDNDKATQTEGHKQEEKESQTDMACGYAADFKPYCEDKLKGTCETNEDAKVTITTSGAQFQISSSVLAPRINRVPSDPTDASDERDADKTQSKLSHLQKEGGQELTSEILKGAPSLNPGTFNNDVEFD